MLHKQALNKGRGASYYAEDLDGPRHDIANQI